MGGRRAGETHTTPSPKFSSRRVRKALFFRLRSADAISVPRTTGRPPRPHWVVAAIGAVGVALHALAVPEAWKEWSYDGVELFMLAAMVWAVLHHRPQPARPWWLLTGGLTLLVVGDVIYNALTRINGEEVFPSAADVLYVASYGVFSLGLMAVVRTRRRRDPTALLDAGLVTVVAAAATWAYLVDPSSYRGVALVEALFSAAYPIGDMVVLGFLVRLLISSRRRTPAERVLTLGIGLLLLADLAYARLAITGNYSMGSWLDVIYHVSYLCLPVAAAHPSMRSMVAPERGVITSGRSRLWLLAAVSLVLPAFAASEMAAGDQGKAIVLAAASAIAFFLLTFRTGVLNGSLAQALAGERLARAGERESLERKRVLRELGVTLVGMLDRDAICAAAADHARRLGGPGADAALFVHGGGPLVTAATAGFGPGGGSSLETVTLPSELTTLLDQGQSVALGAEDGGALRAWLPADLRPRWLVVAPIVTGARRTGLAVVLPDPEMDGPDRLRAACGALASAVSVALEAAELSERLLDERSGARFEAMIRNSSDVVMVLRSDGTVRFVSPSVTRILGWGVDHFVDERLADLVLDADRESLHSALAAVMDRPGLHTPVELRVRHEDGSWRFLEVIAASLVDDASLGAVVLNVRDVTDRVHLEHELTHRAHHDGLTGLANRDLFLAAVEQAIARSVGTAHQVELLFVDLDDFKTVNDSLGHKAGDEVLVAVADRLRQCVRSADTVARLGGDEFAILLDGDWENCSVVAERIVDVMRAPLTVVGQQVSVRASVGLASSEPGTEATDLLRQADLAMYVAKSEGKARWVAFRPQMLEQFLDELQMERALQAAVQHDQLDVYYQPIVDLATGLVAGAEALVRWIDPARGVVSPAQFIPVAERSELIEVIGRYVLQRACRWAGAWEAESGKTLAHVSVNVSARQLRSPSLVQDVCAALEESGLAPHKLVLEITESMLLDERDAVTERLEALRQLGVRIAIDDFGTGYSSLSYLGRLPVDVLKIDRSFTIGLGHAAERSLVPAILELARTLGLMTVAEGVETEQHGRRLRELGCQLAQGYYFSKPLPEAEMTEALRGIPVLAPAPVPTTKPS